MERTMLGYNWFAGYPRAGRPSDAAMKHPLCSEHTQSDLCKALNTVVIFEGNQFRVFDACPPIQPSGCSTRYCSELTDILANDNRLCGAQLGVVACRTQCLKCLLTLN